MIVLYTLVLNLKTFTLKKLLSLLFVLTIVACGGSDDDEGVNIDPIIGKWGGNCYEDSREYVHYRDDGIWIFYEALTNGSIMANHSGTWVNNGDDLTSDNQNYTMLSNNLNVDPDSFFVWC